MSYTTILTSTTTTTDAPEASRPYSIALSSDLVRAPMVLKSLRIALIRQGTSRLRMAGYAVQATTSKVPRHTTSSAYMGDVHKVTRPKPATIAECAKSHRMMPLVATVRGEPEKREAGASLK